MTKTRDIQNFYHRLLELEQQGYYIEIKDNSFKNYVAYYIGKKNGNAEYKDCVVAYNGDETDEDQENVCQPQDIPAEELLEEVNEIVCKIDKVFTIQ